MPLSGTGDVLGLAIQAAQDAAASAWHAALSGRAPTDSDKAQLRANMAKAMGNAIITHLTATAGTAAVAGVTTGAGVASLV